MDLLAFQQGLYSMELGQMEAGITQVQSDLNFYHDCNSDLLGLFPDGQILYAK